MIIIASVLLCCHIILLSISNQKNKSKYGLYSIEE